MHAREVNHRSPFPKFAGYELARHKIGRKSRGKKARAQSVSECQLKGGATGGSNLGENDLGGAWHGVPEISTF